MIHTYRSIEAEVSQISGTHVKRNNLRKRLKEQSNNTVNERIDTIRREIRLLKAEGVREKELSPIYAKVTQLEIRLIP